GRLADRERPRGRPGPPRPRRPGAALSCARGRDQGRRRPAGPLRDLERRPPFLDQSGRDEPGPRGRPRGAGVQPGRSPRGRPPPCRGAPGADDEPGGRPRRPADLVLSRGLGLAVDLLGVVPLSAEVDRLMGNIPWPFTIQLELTRPWWLAGLAVLPILVYYFYRTLVDFVRWQRALSLVFRSVIVVLLLLALAGLSLVRPTRDLFVVFAIDRSESVGEEGNKAIDDFLARA